MTPSRKKDTQAQKGKATKSSGVNDPVGPSEQDVSSGPASEGGAIAGESDGDNSVGTNTPLSPVASAGDAAIERIVVFHLAGQRYGLPIEAVQEIQQIVAFSEVPSQGGPVVGMVNLRGVVIPAVDMRALVGMPREEYRLETPMIISRTRDDLVALIVDSVDDVILVPEGCVQPVSAMHSLADRMLGVCQIATDLVYVLDIARIVAPVTGVAD